jgi:hypothetical protein
MATTNSKSPNPRAEPFHPNLDWKVSQKNLNLLGCIYTSVFAALFSGKNANTSVCKHTCHGSMDIATIYRKNPNFGLVT